jgi:hypothetical protein
MKVQIIRKGETEKKEKLSPEESLDTLEQLRLEGGKFLYEYPARLRRTVTIIRKT